MPPAILVNSTGGRIGDFLDYFQGVIDAGQQLIIAGSVCASACTLFAAIPQDRVCVQKTVMLKFHAAWTYQGFAQVKHEFATALMMSLYPEPVRNWIIAKGGLTEPNVYRVMKYPETAKFFRICGP